MELARSGGAEAVVLREATRRTGVSPNAAYRHFDSREALLDEVAVRASRKLAESMKTSVARARAEFAGSDPKTIATEVILSACRGYIGFALMEPGWFNVSSAISDRAMTYLYDGASMPSGESATHEEPEDGPRTARAVLADVLVLPEGISWAPSISAEDLELMLRSMLYGFSVLSTVGALRREDHTQLEGRLLSLIRASVAGAIKQ
ncbi:TetR family transcriptional regulator [Acidipropionibacterium acidipropionici ATCC 4875]|uniref:TetR family transcriptional regulator n=2 Tax=Acidipropionibacterium acidipropionici TaxID=1748 RepID=K7RSK2_ACIA4|nr:TetR family transcriptional regulator [Acidipropionibacterium acidipropionici ATCC 4875]